MTRDEDANLYAAPASRPNRRRKASPTRVNYFGDLMGYISVVFVAMAFLAGQGYRTIHAVIP
jgi:hypothetical protein